MNAFNVSILLSAGSVKVTSTSSFSSSGLAGAGGVFRSVTVGPVGLVEFAATSVETGEAFAAGLSVVCGSLGEGAGTTSVGVATGAVSDG